MVEEVNLLILARRWETRRRPNNHVGILSPDTHTALDAASPVALVLDRGLITSTMFPKPHLRWLASWSDEVSGTSAC